MSELLFADDDEALRQLVSEVLGAAGHHVRLARNGVEALAEVRRSPPDLVILDYRMGRPDGFEVCRDIKSDPQLSHTPVLILTAERSIEDRLGGFDAGADDYLPKPFDPRELVARVGAMVRHTRRALDRNPTSGLPGGEAVHAEIARRRSSGVPFAICYFDLDHFKPFADRFGFATADAAIREAGQAVVSVAQGDETFVGHVGGDDFVVMCPRDQARRIAEQVREAFAARLEFHLPPEAVRAGAYRAQDRYGIEREFPITRLSAAIARIDPAHFPTTEHLGEAVAELKKEAKAEGGPGIAEGDIRA